MATEKSWLEEVERSKSTAFLNLIIRLYSLGEYPVWCLNLRSKCLWHKHTFSTKERIGSWPLERLMQSTAYDICFSILLLVHKAWVRKDSISLILSCMYGCSHNLSASESLKIPPDSKVLILWFPSSSNGNYMKRNKPQGRKRIPNIWMLFA